MQSNEAGIPPPTIPVDTTDMYLSGEFNTVDKLYAQKASDGAQASAEISQKYADQQVGELNQFMQQQMVILL